MPGPLLYAMSLRVRNARRGVRRPRLIGIPCLRLRGDYLAIATLGFGEIVRIAIQNSPRTVARRQPRHPTIPRQFSWRSGRASEGPDFRLDDASDRGRALRRSHLGASATTSGRRRDVACSPSRRTRRPPDSSASTRRTSRCRRSSSERRSRASRAASSRTTRARSRRSNFYFMEMVKMFLIIVLGGMGSLSGCVVGAFLVIGTERRSHARARVHRRMVAGRVPADPGADDHLPAAGPLRSARVRSTSGARARSREGERGVSETSLQDRGLTKRYGGLTAVQQREHGAATGASSSA